MSNHLANRDATAKEQVVGFSSPAFHSQSHAGMQRQADFVPSYRRSEFARAEKVDRPPIGERFRPISDRWPIYGGCAVSPKFGCRPAVALLWRGRRSGALQLS